MKFTSATRVHGKSRVAKWGDLLFLFRFSHTLFSPDLCRALEFYISARADKTRPTECTSFLESPLCCFVSGHDFSRAVKGNKDLGFSPCVFSLPGKCSGMDTAITGAKARLKLILFT
jgi:hypothetical protein